MTKPLVLSQIVATSYGAIIRINTASGIFDVFSWLSKYYLFVCFRHLNASLMLALGIPDKYAMERGGWSTPSTLKSVYQHTFTEERKKVDEQIDGFFNALLNEESSPQNNDISPE